MGGGEARSRRDRSDAGAARSRQAGLLLRRAALLHADIRAERNLAAIAVGDLFADDARAGVRDRLRNVRRQYCAGSVRDVGIQSAGGGIRAHGANVFDADSARARATVDAVASAQASECGPRRVMRRGRAPRCSTRTSAASCLSEWESAMLVRDYLAWKSKSDGVAGDGDNARAVRAVCADCARAERDADRGSLARLDRNGI